MSAAAEAHDVRQLHEDELRAVVFVIAGARKGTARSAQEYESPLLVLSGAEYTTIRIQVLHDRLCDALRGAKPRIVLEVLASDSTTQLVFEDGSTARVDGHGESGG